MAKVKAVKPPFLDSLVVLCFLLAWAPAQNGYWQQWLGEWTTSASRETILWFTRNYGASIGAKCVLESSGGAELEHGEDSFGPLGLSLAEASKRRSGLDLDVLQDLLENNRHFQGQLAKEIDDENRHNMRLKIWPELCAAMVYPGWRNWNNPDRLNRGLRDLQWQDFLEGMINEQ